ncbi:hypothetical protein B7P43_G01994 [Cryptotermes secundus]|uniref:C2H2-type domain-containing protein n=1 Tax=Cryptotermes secundus TaxID=105785 RepID=A0A2J7Q9D3_9NEOP|nr:hypothetical protein B7P43_G01994 [Cryptotermes secundus]
MYSQTNVEIKQERPNMPSSTSPPPPLLSPELPLTLQPLQPLPSTPPVPPIVKLSQDISATNPVPNNLYTNVHAENLQHTSAASPANIVFLNSEQGEYFLPEGSEAATSDTSTDDHDAGFPDLGVSEKMAPDTKTETSRTESRKRNNSSGSVQKSKKRKKTQNHFRSPHNNQVNGFRTVMSEDSNKERSAEYRKPGPKCHVRAQQASISDMLNLRSEAKEPEQENKVKHKSGPKSQVAGNNDNLDSDNSDVEFVLYKPPNSFLDVIDLTDAVDKSVEGENGNDPKEALVPHVVMTKIPGMCNIYTCSFCEGSFTSARSANRHMCKVNRLFSVSPTEVELGGKNPEEKTLGEEASKNKVPEEMTSEDKTEGKGTSEGQAEGQNTTEKNVLEYAKGSSDGSTLNEHTFSASSKLLSELQRVTSETKSAETGHKDNGSEVDTSSASSGSHICDICGVRCTRLVALASHKDRHLYSMNEYEEDSCDNVLFNVRKKKKRTLKTVTESE